MSKPENRTIFTGDNLPIMRGMDDGSADLIYLDPPFNSNRNYKAPTGTEAAGAAFKDAWTLDDTDEAWWGEIAERHPPLHSAIDATGRASGRGAKGYSIYMAVRLLEMHRILKSTGSIYLHCDPHMGHCLRLLLDCIFGRANFRNEIVWAYGLGGSSPRYFSRKHDIILFYTKTGDWCFNKPAMPSTSAMLGGRQKGMLDVWMDIPSLNNMAKERTGYPTQKPLALLERIIRASSNEGDMVLDPFCGCATSCVAAEKARRQWVGIDISPLAHRLAEQRIKKHTGTPPVRAVQRVHIAARQGDRASKNIGHILFGRQEGLCAGCRIQFPYRNLRLDHIVPRSRGGADNEHNLQLLCGACNSVKGDRVMAYLLAQLKKDGIL